MKKTGMLLFACIGLVLTACDRSPPGQAVMLGEYSVVFSHQPSPLMVGLDALLQLNINDQNGQPQRACKVGVRQFMPGMEMAHDQVLIPLPADNDGVYRGKTSPFSMGGEWVLKITIDCGDGPVSHPFTYQLEWPE